MNCKSMVCHIRAQHVVDRAYPFWLLFTTPYKLGYRLLGRHELSNQRSR